MITRKEIEEGLRINQAWLEKAIVVIYDRQTRDEKVSSGTHHENNIGFNKPDASKLSYYARWILSGRRLNGRHLDDARARMMKYSGQLLSIAIEKAKERMAAQAAPKPATSTVELNTPDDLMTISSDGTEVAEASDLGIGIPPLSFTYKGRDYSMVGVDYCDPNHEDVAGWNYKSSDGHKMLIIND